MLRRSCPVPTTARAPWPVRARAAVTAPLTGFLSRRAARPSGLFGRLLGRIWLWETAHDNDVALELLAPAPGERICEIGFGPGRTLGLLAEGGAEVIGVDVSDAMVGVAVRRNAKSIAAGVISVHRGDGTVLPVPDDSLDGVLSVHNFYFWPDPRASLADIARALRPGGRLVLSSLADDRPLAARFDPEIYRVPAIADVTAWLRAAGFVDVSVTRRPELPAAVWFTAVVA
jgi:SAM-dependent methyltransferase